MLRRAALLALVSATPPAAASATDAVAVAAASDLQYALEEIAQAFRAEHPGADLRITYGSSGNFVAQIASGAPFDVFLSADAAYAERIVDAGLAEPGDLFAYALGRLALWVPPGSGLDIGKLGLRALLDHSVSRVAIANPAHAPYGRAAQAALRSAGIQAEVAPKLVLGENAAQAAQFAASGAAQAGLIPLSLALAPPMQKGRHVEVPGEAYPALVQKGLVLRRAAGSRLARDLAAFLRGPAAVAILQRHGFLVPR